MLNTKTNNNEYELIERNNISNPNLLINSNFKINQRGQSSYKSTSSAILYTVDRWKIINITLVPSDTGITISCDSTTDGWISQALESELIGNYICSFEITEINGTIGCHLQDSEDGITKKIEFDQIGTYNITNTKIKKVIFHVFKGSSCKIKWVKLEPGLIATPYIEPNSIIELEKCRFYYRKFSTWNETFQVHGNQKLQLIQLSDIKMRVSPTYNTTNVCIGGVTSSKTCSFIETTPISVIYNYETGLIARCNSNINLYNGTASLTNDLELDSEIY